MTGSLFDTRLDRLSAGQRLSPDEIRELVATPDILPLGMLADSVRRRLRGTQATFLRVATCRFDQSFTDVVPPAAREIRIVGAPETLGIAITAAQTAREVAGRRTVAGFSWTDIERWAADADTAQILEKLRNA